MLVASLLIGPTESLRLWAAHARLARLRADSIRCCAVPQPPPDLNTVCAQARAALQEAVLSGKRGLTVDASMASLDVKSRAFDAAVFSRFVLEISKALTVLDGPVLLLMPGMSTVSKARELLDSADVDVWPGDARERLSITTVGTHGAPTAGAAGLPSAVVVAGLTPSTDADDNSYRAARAWLEAAPVAVCINARVTTPPVEMAAFEAAYCVMAYTIAKTDTRRGADAQRYAEDSGTAMLLRSYPGRWQVVVDSGNQGEWELAQEMGRRPSDDEMNAIVLPQFRKRQAALDSAERALSGAAPPSTATPPAAVGAAGGMGGDDGGRGGPVAADGLVSLRGAQLDDGFGPRALYGALALHRLRALGDDACLDPSADEAGLHLLLLEAPEDAAAVSDPSFGKMRGGYLVTCQLIPDGAGTSVASLIQLAVSSGATADAIKSVLGRAVDEATAAGQERIVIEAPPSLAGSEAERCLLELGFEGGDRLSLSLVGAEEVRSGGSGADLESATKEEPPAPALEDPSEDASSEGDAGDDDQIQLTLSAPDADDEEPDATGEGEEEEGEDGPADGAIQFGSEEDIARLKRMFGEPL